MLVLLDIVDERVCAAIVRSRRLRVLQIGEHNFCQLLAQLDSEKSSLVTGASRARACPH